MAITGFESGKWYRYTGHEHKDGWNPTGKMDFCLDNKPHQCNEGGRDKTGIEDFTCASFYDSLEPEYIWNWTNGFDLWEEVIPEKKTVVSSKSKMKTFQELEEDTF